MPVCLDDRSILSMDLSFSPYNMYVLYNNNKNHNNQTRDRYMGIK